MSENQFQETTYDGDYYREIGGFQQELYGGMGFVLGTVQEVDFLVNLFHLTVRILDVGCATVRHNLEFAQRSFYPVGVGISSGLVEEVRALVAAERLDTAFHVGNALTPETNL